MPKPKSNTLIFVIGGVILLGICAFLVYTFVIQKGILEKGAVLNAPEGCPNVTSIVVISEEAGTQEISTENSNFIHWSNDQGLLTFTNYTLDTDNVYGEITGENVLAVVKLSHNLTTPLTTGVYSKTTTVQEGPTLYASEFNISTEDLAGGVFDDEATVEITYFGTDYVCGTVTSDDGSSSINGEFIAKYVDKL